MEIVRLEGIQRRVTKLIKRVKDYSYIERLEKLGLTTFLERRMGSDLIDTFKIINGISNYQRNFSNFSSNWKFTVKTDINKKSIGFFCL